MAPKIHRHLPANRLLALLFALTIAGPLVADEVKRPADPGKYTGPGSCAAPACHGRVQPREQTGVPPGEKIAVWQNEYSTWLLRDKHTQAFEALRTPVGKRMGRILRLKKNPEDDDRCLLCHALPAAAPRAKSFDTKEGVSCENCHGPASGWLGPHTEGKLKDGTATQRAIKSQGMVDTSNLIVRAEKCLECHLGDEKRCVDHEMIAAGHPDLYFELESFSTVMPRHWKEPPDKEPPDDVKGLWLGVRTMGTGQAVQLREALRRLARRAQSSVWPEYAELQCYACHHSLTAAKDSWRQERGYANRRPGDVPWDESRYAVFRHLALVVDAPAVQRLDAELGKLSGLVSLHGKADQISSIATNASGIADGLARRIATAEFDEKKTRGLMQSISGNTDGISSQDERAAEQAAMALDSLFLAYTHNVKLSNQAQVKAAIEGLFLQFNDPSSYNASKFARQLHALNALLPR